MSLRASNTVHPGSRASWDRLTGLLIVLALHGAAFYGLWHYQIPFTPREAVTLFVDFITPSPPAQEAQPRPAARPKPPPLEPVAPPPPEPPPLAVEAPVVMPSEPVAPPPPPQPVIEAPPEPPQPVHLTTELAVACPRRTPPLYPVSAKALGEEGRVVVEADVDEQGRIGAARIHSSSGSPRLDAAALTAVKSWRCTPAVRNGTAVPVVARQGFTFRLEGR